MDGTSVKLRFALGMPAGVGKELAELFNAQLAVLGEIPQVDADADDTADVCPQNSYNESALNFDIAGGPFEGF